MASLNSGPRFQVWVSKEYFTNSSLLPSFATVPSNARHGHEQHGQVKSCARGGVSMMHEHGQLFSNVSEVTEVTMASQQPHGPSLWKGRVSQL